MMVIEVAQAWPDRQVLVKLCVTAQTTVAQAIEQAGLVDLPSDLSGMVGIFSKPCALDQQLQSGDRVEVYRPLLVDPKTQRRGRAVAQKKDKNKG